MKESELLKHIGDCFSAGLKNPTPSIKRVLRQYVKQTSERQKIECSTKTDREAILKCKTVIAKL